MGRRRARRGVLAARAPASRSPLLVASLCGLCGGRASAAEAGAAQARRAYAEVEPSSSAIFVTKAQVQAMQEAEDAAQARRATASSLLCRALEHAAVLGACELLFKRERPQEGLEAADTSVPQEAPPEVPREVPREVPQEVPRGRQSKLGWPACGFLLGASLGWAVARRRYLKRVRDAQAVAERLETENASLQEAHARRGSLSSYSSSMASEGASQGFLASRAPLEDALVDVFLRIRPGGQSENALRCLSVNENQAYLTLGHRELQFSFKGIVDSSSGRQDQEDVFNMIGAQAVQSVLDGYNTCIFSLGQTGTGKTHTLIGSPDDPGLLPRMVCQLLQNRQPCRLSCMEVYMDKLRDLLAEDAGECPPLEVRGDTCGSYVSNLREVSLEDPETAMRLLNLASRNRCVARTSMNATSSRGHGIYQFEFGAGVKLCVVDLAGRENERSTGCRGQNLAELIYINKSLFHLTLVLQALARPSARGVVPFRNSKLTMLLSECLQGSRLMLVAAVGPDASSAEETLTTMRLAQTVGQITTRTRRQPSGVQPEAKEPPASDRQRRSSLGSSLGSVSPHSLGCTGGSTTPRGPRVGISQCHETPPKQPADAVIMLSDDLVDEPSREKIMGA